MHGPLPPREVVVPDDAMVPRAVSSLIDGTSSPSNLFSSAKLTLWSYSRKAVVLILSCSFFPPLLNSVTVEGASSAPRRGRAAPPPPPHVGPEAPQVQRAHRALYPDLPSLKALAPFRVLKTSLRPDMFSVAASARREYICTSTFGEF